MIGSCQKSYRKLIDKFYLLLLYNYRNHIVLMSLEPGPNLDSTLNVGSTLNSHARP